MRRALTFILAAVNNRLVLPVLKVFKIRTVFMIYPENLDFACHYVYRPFVRIFRWRANLLGAYKQNGELGLIFGTQFGSFDNNKAIVKGIKEGRLGKLIEIFEYKRRLVGAKRIALAGTMPSICRKYGVNVPVLDTEATPLAVATALVAAIKLLDLDKDDTAVVLLGGNGFVARNLVSHLIDLELEIISIDLENRSDFFQNVIDAYSSNVIILNCTWKGELGKYFEDIRRCREMKPLVAILDEVYPGLDRFLVQLLSHHSIPYIRVKGVAADWVYPAFPFEYGRGGFVFPASGGGENIEDLLLQNGYDDGLVAVLPCCAAHLPISGKLRIVIERLC